jgi:dGTPase
MEHSLHVSSICSTICKRLDLNTTLAEAIAISHDLGHPPFGHLGEKAIELVHQDYNESHKGMELPAFCHEAQSLRVIDYFKNSLHERLSLTYEVRDGVVCHCGERNERILMPEYEKDIKSVDASAARKQHPATIEGCVVRMADTISYLGRDFEDACMAHLIKPTELPQPIKEALGTNNSQIIGTLINDLVQQSAGLEHLEFSERVYDAMVQMKAFNYKSIYKHPSLSGQDERIHLILKELFDYFLDILEDKKKSDELKSGNHPSYFCVVFADFLRDMEYSESTNKGQIVSDFISGMTDNFALNCFVELFTVQRVI